MAKAKKGKLTIEDALVPVYEQPYEIPENWCWVYGKAVFADMETKKPSGDSFGYIDIDSIDNVNQRVTEPKITETEKAPSRASRKLHAGDTVFSMVRPYLKNIAYISEDLADCIASTGFYICTPKDNVDSKYLYQLMISPYVVDGLNLFMKGDNSPSIRKDDIESFAYPLPPLAEQQRIAEQIENFFSKLDEAKEKAQEVVEQFELHKESILHQAFSGRLSKKWRNENEISDDSWKQTTLGLYLNPMKTRKPEGETFRYIDIDAIDNKRQVIREAKETLVSEAPSRASRAVNSGDVLFSMVRPYLKNIAYVTEDMSDCIASTGFYVCSCKDGLYSKYLYELLRSKDAIDYLMQFMKGDNSPSIRKDDLLDMPLRLPCTDEQKEICHIVSSLLQKEEEAKEAAVKVIDQIDLMKKSILAKAFRGELGTNNSEEESSVELLKQIISE